MRTTPDDPVLRSLQEPSHLSHTARNTANRPKDESAEDQCAPLEVGDSLCGGVHVRWHIFKIEVSVCQRQDPADGRQILANNRQARSVYGEQPQAWYGVHSPLDHVLTRLEAAIVAALLVVV
jgi:hypothetical protein